MIAPVFNTRHLSLSPLSNDDIPEAYALAMDGTNWIRWILRGSTNSISDYAARLFSPNILSQMVARTRSDGTLVAHVLAYEGTKSHVKVAIVSSASDRRLGMPGEAFGCFIDFLFMNFPIRKVYVEMLEPEWERQHHLGRLFGVEGALREHEYYGGRWVDLIIASSFREQFYSAIGNLRPLWLDGLIESGLVLARHVDGSVGPLGLPD